MRFLIYYYYKTRALEIEVSSKTSLLYTDVQHLINCGDCPHVHAWPNLKNFLTFLPILLANSE
jgi:hypothetical protein